MLSRVLTVFFFFAAACNPVDPSSDTSTEGAESGGGEQQLACCDGDYTIDQCEVNGWPPNHVDCFGNAQPPAGCVENTAFGSLWCCPSPAGEGCATASRPASRGAVRIARGD